jgi:hypothetical protein
MSKLAWLCAILAFQCVTAQAQPAGQVPKALATLTIHLASTSVRAGDPITVTFLLKAGPNGAYFPNYFRNWIATCEHGFYAVILKRDGTSADPNERGCGRSTLHSPDETVADALARFVHLAPNETRTWTTSVQTADIAKGDYKILGEYLSNADGIDEVARLNEVHGLVVKGPVDAEPVAIEIK